MRVLFLVIILSIGCFAQELQLNQEYFISKDGMFFKSELEKKGIVNSPVSVDLFSDKKIITEKKEIFKATPNIVMGNIPNGSPLLGELSYSSPFGKRGKRQHRGVDLRAAKGTPIIATANGVIEFAGYDGAYGKKIVIDHGFGVKTLYAHLNEISVKKNDRVTKEEILGKTGRTGRVTGPHLHYEVSYYDKKVDPKKFIELNTINYSMILRDSKDINEILVAIIKGKNKKVKS